MGILTGSRVLLRELVRGKADFPGRGRGSRVATHVFPRLNKTYISRENLYADYNVTMAKLDPANQAIFFQSAITHKLFLRSERRKLSLLPAVAIKLEHFHFRKTLTKDNITAFVAALNTDLEGLCFKCDNTGHFELEAPQPAKTSPQPETGSIKNQILEILKKENRPLSQGLIRQKLKESGFVITQDRIFDQLVREMFTSDGTLGRALGYEKIHVFYAKEKENDLLAAQLIHRVIDTNGLEMIYTDRRLQWDIEKGEVSPVLNDQIITYYNHHFLTRRSGIDLVPYYTEKGRVFIQATVLETVQAREKLLWGRNENGEKVAVQNTAASRQKHHDLLVRYETNRLDPALKDEIIAAAKAQNQPTYFLLYRARKLIGIGASIELALLSIRCDNNANEDKTLQQYQEISAWDFDMRIRSRHYIENFMGTQRQVADKLDVLRLFLASRLAKAVYQNEDMDQKAWDEARFLCAPTAEQHGFNTLSEQFKDLRLMNVDLPAFLEAAAFFRRQTGMSRLEALEYLEERAIDLKAKTCAWLGLTADEVTVYFRPKSYSSISSKERDILDLLGLRIVINCKGENPIEAERASIAKLKELQPKLIEHFNAGVIKDNIEQARLSGWRALKINGRAPQEQEESLRPQIEVIAQTEEMYRLEKQAQMSQTHWARDINKEKGIDQEFDPVPWDTAQQLGSDPDKNFEILKKYDQDNYVFVFTATIDEGDNKEATLLDIPRLNENHLKALRAYPKRLSKVGSSNPIAEDVFCRSRQTRGYNLRDLSRVEVFRFAKDRKGNTILKRKALPNDQPYEIQSGDLLVFHRESKKIRPHNNTVIEQLNKQKKWATYYFTKFKAWQERREAALANDRENRPKDYKQKKNSHEEETTKLREKGETTFTGAYHQIIEQKQKSAQYQQIEDLAKIMGVVANNFRFNDPADFLIAIGLEIIDLDRLKREIDAAIDNTGYTINIKPLANNQIEITLSTLEAKGLTSQLYAYGVISPSSLIAFSTQRYFSAKQPRVEIKFTIDTTKTTLDQETSRGSIIAILNSFLYPETSGFTTTQITRPQIDVITLGTYREASGQWSDFGKLVSLIREKEGFDICQIKLLPDQDQGMVRIEVPSLILKDETRKKALFEELQDLGLVIEEEAA